MANYLFVRALAVQNMDNAIYQINCFVNALFPEQAVRVRALVGALCCVLVQDT